MAREVMKLHRRAATLWWTSHVTWRTPPCSSLVCSLFVCLSVYRYLYWSVYVSLFIYLCLVYVSMSIFVCQLMYVYLNVKYLTLYPLATLMVMTIRVVSGNRVRYLGLVHLCLSDCPCLVG